jgi:hypothetical protein
MTEVNIDGVNLGLPKLKPDSRLIILLKSPEGIKGISKKISSFPEAKRVQRGLFIFSHITELHKIVLRSQPRISLVKTREIPKLSMKTEEVYSKLIYSVVAFSYSNPSAKQKKYVERLIKKSTGIRVRPGIIIFPILRTKLQRKIMGAEGEKNILTSTDFAKLVRENGGRVYRWSRLRITNPNGARYIENAIEQTLLKDLSSLEEKIQNLREQCKKPDIEIALLKKNYSVLSRSFHILKKKWMLARKIWFYDAEKPLKRTYNMLINTRRTISML